MDIEKQALAKSLMGQDKVIFGYELEDGELGQDANGHFIHQMLVLPYSLKSFRECWKHGKKFC